MRSHRRHLTALALVALGGAMLPLAVAGAPAAAAGPSGELASGTQVTLLAGPTGSHTYQPPMVVPPEVGTESATIVVHYTNFTAEQQAAFQYAVDLWQALIVSPVTIEINADFASLGSGILGSAGPDFLDRDECGAMTPGTFYPGALANALCGSDLNGSAAEASATFNSSFSQWYFGLDGNPGGSQYDFVTVVMHELGHALGFLGSMDGSGATGRWGGFGGCSACPMIFDRFAKNGADEPLVDGPFPNHSTALKAQLVSNNIFFDGPNTDAANGGVPAKLFAPTTWQSGSSFSHPDESTFNNTPNALMTPVLNGGEAIHSPGPVVLGTFEDMGWVLPVAPDAPTNVVAVAGSNAAKVAFDAPSNGGSAITQYTVTASPGPAVETGTASGIWIAGLDNGTPYTFTVTATNAFGTSPPSVASSPVTPMLHGFHALAPTRILDTRSGIGLVGPGVGAPPTGPLTPQQVLAVKVAGQPGGPPIGADAVVMNVTAVKPTSSGWLKVFPSDASSPPNASNLNFSAGQTVPNLVTVKLGADGKVKVANTDGSLGAGSTHVLFDVVGWYASDGSGAELDPSTPTRILDTRVGIVGADPRHTALAPQETYAVDIAGVGPVPNDATAVVMNVTAVKPTKSGWLTLFPSDQSLPTVSNLNFTAGQTVPNLVEAKLGADGAVKVNNTGGNISAGFTNVIFDVVGWYGPSTSNGGLDADRPVRIFDTRNGIGLVGSGPGTAPTGALGPQELVDVHVAGEGGVPSNGVSAVVMNVTAVTPTANGFLTLWPGGTMPTASNLNFVAGKTVPNLVVVALGPGGTVRIGNTIGSSAAGFTHVIFDVVGWFADTP